MKGIEKMENTQTKINFLKKAWFSIAKISKYEDMREEGVGKAIKYFFALISLFAIILALIGAILQASVTKEAFSYLEENLPEIKYKDNHLTTENKDATILDDDKFKEYFKNAVVINPLLEKQEAIDEYKSLATNTNNVIVFLNDQYVIITNKYNAESDNEEGIEAHTYVDEFAKYIKDNSKEYSKNDVISYLKQRTSYSYYIAQFFVFYLGTLALLYLFYILLISVSLWLVTKISKIKWTFKKSLMNTIYASTLSIWIYVLYLIVSYFAEFRISFMDIISVFIIFVYLFLLLSKDRNLKNN